MNKLARWWHRTVGDPHVTFPDTPEFGTLEKVTTRWDVEVRKRDVLVEVIARKGPLALVKEVNGPCREWVLYDSIRDLVR
jgi:hypothetical protein